MTDASLSPSGLSPVDAQWGGFTLGHSYLLVGRAGAGRSALALQTVRAATEAGERVLTISPREPNDLVEDARSIGLDLAAAHREGHLRLLRIPSAADLAARGVEGLTKSYHDLEGLVASDKPSRVVIEDFTPLVQFDTFERFRDAFQRLAGALETQGVTLIIGLGEPGNDASRRLLEVVEETVVGTILLGSDGQLTLRGGPPAAETVSGAAPTFGAAPDLEDAPRNEPALDLEDAPHDEPAFSLEDNAPTEDVSVPTPAPDEAPALEQQPAADNHTDAPAPSIDPFALESVGDGDGDGFSTTFTSSNESSGDSSAVAEPPQPEMPAAPPILDTPPPVPQQEIPGAPASSGVPPPTEVIPPPPADASLLAPTADIFGYDPADEIIEQGFLADSSGGEIMGQIQQQPAATTSAPLPSFAPLGGAPSIPDSFRPALEAAFATRPATPFVVVALRMEPTAPEAAHFGTVEDAIRSGLSDGDRVLVNAERKRAIVLLTNAKEDRGQALFSNLQSHLEGALGAQAEGIRQAIGAVTIPNGQPFDSAPALLAYAYDG